MTFYPSPPSMSSLRVRSPSRPPTAASYGTRSSFALRLRRPKRRSRSPRHYARYVYRVNPIYACISTQRYWSSLRYSLWGSFLVGTEVLPPV